MNTNMTGCRWYLKSFCVLVFWAKIASALEGLIEHQVCMAILISWLYGKMAYFNARFQGFTYYAAYFNFSINIYSLGTLQKLTQLVFNYCIKGNVNVCLMFPNLPNGFETGTIKTLSLITFVGMLGQAMFVFRLSNTAIYLTLMLLMANLANMK